MTTLHIQPKDLPQFADLDKVRNHFKSQGVDHVSFKKPKFNKEPKAFDTENISTDFIQVLANMMFSFFKK